jgi:hypothetical protein
MRLRELRIAFSATCLIACVQLIALWVRSYWRWDYIQSPFGSKGWLLSSLHGKLGCYAGPPSAGFTEWRYFCDRIDDPKDEIYLPRIFSLPDGFSVLVFTVLAAVPWLPWLRWRFSLRTLLIATTLIALVLGTFVWFSR